MLFRSLFSKGDRQSVAVSDAEGYDVVSRSYNGETIYIGLNIKGEAKTITIPVKDNGVNAYEDLYGKTKNGTSSALLVPFLVLPYRSSYAFTPLSFTGMVIVFASPLIFKPM